MEYRLTLKGRTIEFHAEDEEAAKVEAAKERGTQRGPWSLYQVRMNDEVFIDAGIQR